MVGDKAEMRKADERKVSLAEKTSQKVEGEPTVLSTRPSLHHQEPARQRKAGFPLMPHESANRMPPCP
jgi:hypothetical protein